MDKCKLTFDELVERYQKLDTPALEELLIFIVAGIHDVKELISIPRKDCNEQTGWQRWSSYEKITYGQEREVVEFVLFERQVLGIER